MQVGDFQFEAAVLGVFIFAEAVGDVQGLVLVQV